MALEHRIPMGNCKNYLNSNPDTVERWRANNVALGSAVNTTDTNTATAQPAWFWFILIIYDLSQEYGMSSTLF
jgi:hypothetical protein